MGLSGTVTAAQQVLVMTLFLSRPIRQKKALQSQNYMSGSKKTLIERLLAPSFKSLWPKENRKNLCQLMFDAIYMEPIFFDFLNVGA